MKQLHLGYSKASSRAYYWRYTLRPRVTEAVASPPLKETMTKPKLKFDPYSQEYFDNPYEIYRRMRDETPIYYDEDEDFYALTRHADVAAALKDHSRSRPRASATSP